MDARLTTIANRPLSPSQVLLDQARDFSGPGMPAEPGFLEERHTIAGDFESASPRRGKGDFGVWVFVLELSRQTGSSGLVVSNGAVFD